MPLPIISNTYRVTMRWDNGAGQFAENVLHIQSAGATSATVNAAVDANVSANMWNGMSNAFVMRLLSTTKLDGVSAAVQLVTSGAKWTGVQTGDPIINEPILIKEQTGLRGPANRGRLFLPATAEASAASGLLNGATLALMQTAWNNFLTAMTAAAFLPVVASYKHAQATIITAFVVESPLGTQRRRQNRLR